MLTSKVKFKNLFRFYTMKLCHYNSIISKWYKDISRFLEAFYNRIS